MNATEFVTQFFDALDRGAWSHAAALVVPSHAVRFQRGQLSQFVSFLAYRDRLKEPEPHPPGFGSDGEVSSDDLARYSSRELPGFEGSPTLGALAALPPVEYLARHFGEQRMVPCRRVSEKEIIPAPRRILGEVPGPEGWIFVLYMYETFEPGKWPGGAPHVRVLPVHRADSGLTIALNDDLTAAVPGGGVMDDMIGQEPR